MLRCPWTYQLRIGAAPRPWPARIEATVSRFSATVFAVANESSAPGMSTGCRVPAFSSAATSRSASSMAIERANHVWCADITYIPVQRGFLYLVAIMDWASRFVLAWRLSNTLDASFCTDALDEALARHGKPEIFNTDQGSQFTSFAFTGRLQAAGIRISMDGRGRCMDNIFIERLWRSLKYEAIYLHDIADGFTARRLIGEWLRFYNVERPHSALDGRTPAEAYRGEAPVDMMDKPLRALPTSPQAQQQQQEDRTLPIRLSPTPTICSVHPFS